MKASALVVCQIWFFTAYYKLAIMPNFPPSLSPIHAHMAKINLTMIVVRSQIIIEGGVEYDMGSF